jgi:CheY-like chemotaxis protein
MAVRRSYALNAPKPSFYTAQDVARFCEVDLKTVHHWADKGKVSCSRTEGRHLRFRRNDIVRFLRAHGYPLPDALARAKPSVAFALAGADDAAKRLGARFGVRRHASALSAIAHLLSDQPDALVLALEDPTLGGAHALTALKSAAETSWVVLAVLATDDAAAAAAREAGADISLSTRDAAKLTTELARTLAIS